MIFLIVTIMVNSQINYVIIKCHNFSIQLFIIFNIYYTFIIQ